MKVGVITQARMTSTRLPGKVLLEAGDKSMLAHHVDRLRNAGLDVYVATTDNRSDDPLVHEAEWLGCPVFRGSETDVLDRYVGAARAFDLDIVVRVTSDCPLIDGALIAQGIEEYLSLDNARCYLSNSIERTYPRGMDFEIMSTAMLLEADAASTERYQREHVTPYLYQSGRMSVHQMQRSPDASDLRITLDTEADLMLIRTIIEEHSGADLNAADLVEVLRAHPELAAINSHIEQKKLEE